MHSFFSTMCSVSEAGKLLVGFTCHCLSWDRHEWHGMDLWEVVHFGKAL